MKDDEENLKLQIFKLIKKFYELKHKEKKFVPGTTKIHYAGRVFDEKEIIAMTDSVLDFWLTLGKYTDKFEENFSKSLRIKHTILTNSGSSANLLAVSALCSQQFRDTLKPGDEVIIQATTFPTTLNPIIQNNLTPVLLDVNLGTYNIDVEKIEKAITDKTKLIMLAHTLGNPNEMDIIIELAEKYGLYVIEDACDALGSQYKNKYVGTFGDMGTFSFYPAHHISMGEGGAVATDNSLLKTIVTSLRDWGRACFCRWNEKNPNGACKKRFGWQLGTLPKGYDHRYTYTNIGYNLKPLDIQAAMGIEQLKKFPRFIESRKKNFKKLYEIFSRYKDYFILPESLPKSDPCWFAFPLTIKKNAKFDRNDLTSWLEKNKIETRVIFSGNIIHQPAYKNVKYKIFGELKNSDLIMNNSFFIGIYPGITDEMIGYIEQKIKEFFSKI